MNTHPHPHNRYKIQNQSKVTTKKQHRNAWGQLLVISNVYAHWSVKYPYQFTLNKLTAILIIYNINIIMIHLKHLLLSCMVLIVSHCLLGADFGIRVYAGQYQCLVQLNHTFTVFEASTPYGAFNQNVTVNLNQSKRGLMKPENVGVEINICYNKEQNPRVQVQEMMSKLNDQSQYFTEIWVEIIGYNNVNCAWSYNYEENCQYAMAYVEEIKKYGKKVGIQSTLYDWVKVMGKADQCARFVDLPLWYISQNGVPNFNDFRAFGGWVQPAIKNYKSSDLMCNILQVYSNYRQ